MTESAPGKPTTHRRKPRPAEVQIVIASSLTGFALVTPSLFNAVWATVILIVLVLTALVLTFMAGLNMGRSQQ
jgi:hypothetical protein